MSLRNLDKIFRPTRIAVVGASDTPTSVGGIVLRNLTSTPFPGDVYPVNPRHESVQGLRAYPSIADLPERADLAVVCAPARAVPGIVRECGEAGTLGVIILSAGFREAGAEGARLERAVSGEAARFDGMRLIGPNCVGVMAPVSGLNASFVATPPRPGNVAFLSQSGALCASVLDWASEEEIGFSCFVSLGNALDVDFGDLIDYVARDPETHSAVLYVESITGARKFMSAARAFARTKPIVAYKAGRFAESAQAAASHTGAMAGEDAVYDAAFERAGIVRVHSIGEMFACAELLARARPPRGARLAIVTNAGGPGVIATDCLIASHGRLAELSTKTLAELDPILPPFWSHRNPVDLIGDATPERFARAIGAVLADEGVDALLVILAPTMMSSPTGTAREVVRAAQTGKPVLTSFMGARSVREAVSLLNEAGIPTYATPEEAVRAFTYLVAYARNQEILYETPRDVPLAVAQDRERLREKWKRFPDSPEPIGRGGSPELNATGVGPRRIDGRIEGDDAPRQEPDAQRHVLSEIDSKELLASYGIPVTETRAAVSAEQAVACARALGYPVVLKLLSPQITHKSDVGGVALGLLSDPDVERAFERILGSARAARPDATLHGVTVQKMISRPHAIELILGTKRDSTFGAAILVGVGGVTAELLRDRALGLPPLNERLSRRMLESLALWPLLQGYRGRPGVDLARLIEVLLRFSHLVADLPEILELDVNPLLVDREGALALDARVVLDGEALRAERDEHRRYAHLAIRPYPEQYVRETRFRDGTAVTLRPIRPEDEPLWHELLAGCSGDSIYYRFRQLFKRTTHEMAARYCYIDYDREMAIVAEIEVEGRRKLVGVARLVADPDRESAEYAILVQDGWQGKGVGGLLTDYSLEIARRWGLKSVVAETTPDNARMIRAFRSRGFELEYDYPARVVLVRKVLDAP